MDEFFQRSFVFRYHAQSIFKDIDVKILCQAYDSTNIDFLIITSSDLQHYEIEYFFRQDRSISDQLRTCFRLSVHCLSSTRNQWNIRWFEHICKE